MTADTALLVPPHSVQAEQSVLGGLMLENSAWDQVADRLTAGDFYRRDHRLIFQAISELAERNSPFDLVTLSEWLDQRQQLEDIGGLAFLGTMAKNTPSTASLRAYADIVRDRAIERAMIQTAADIRRLADGPEPVAEKLDRAQALVLEISEDRRNAGAPKPARDILTRVVDAVDRKFMAGSAVTGLQTGFADLDAMTAGLGAGDLIIIAGRPSMGKTTFASNIAMNVALRGEPVAFFSLEMSDEQIIERAISEVGRVDYQRLRTGRLADEDWPGVTHAVSRLTPAPLYVDDTPALSIGELRSRARRLKRAHDVKLVVIDYLQLMRAEGENQTQRIGAISAGLKALAKELRVPVIALSQLNRSLEQRSNKRPILSDLRDSGNLEQDADLIAFLYRDEVYNEHTRFQGMAELIIGKQRNGPTGTVHLTYIADRMRFASFAGEWPSDVVEGGPMPRRPSGFTYAARSAGERS